VLDDLRHNIFPQFLRSALYRVYIECMWSLERTDCAITPSSFASLRVLGRGAFGFVNAVIKRDSGHIYAMKCISKKRVMATDSVDTIMSERNFLSEMSSQFVTGLMYATQDDHTLYLIIDLMVGGDLKFHLNKEGRFSVERSRFYAAEVLLGLQHIHSKGILYRDIKLENVLLDNNGHCKISDLGLAVRCGAGGSVRGYAGTPGYTAPEVCLQQSYSLSADFFSLGVMIYRFLSGRKPFQLRSSAAAKKKEDDKKKKGGGHRTGNELDKNVVEMEPEYPDRYFSPSSRSLLKGLMAKNPRNRLQEFQEIKHHSWFSGRVDFGSLEAGNLTPPFVPNQDEINADSLRHIGRPPNDDKYKDVEVTAAFEKQLERFPFVSRRAQQEEMVGVLKSVQRHYDFKQFVDELAGKGQVTVAELAQIPSSDELSKFAQSVEALKRERGVDGFVPSYYLFDGGDCEEVESDEEWSDGEDEEEDSSCSTERRLRGGDSDHDIGHHYDNHDEERYNKIETSSSFKPKKSNHTESTVSHSEDQHAAGSTAAMSKRSGSASKRGTAHKAVAEEEQQPIMDAAAGNTILEDHTTEDSVSGMARNEEAQSAAAGKCICTVL